MPKRHPLLDAVAPLVAATGGEFVDVARRQPGDVALRWEGEVVGVVRLPARSVGIGHLLSELQEEFGCPLRELSREQKQAAVHQLSQRGAFQLRRSVEDVADALGVSRFTVYNYLNAING